MWLRGKATATYERSSGVQWHRRVVFRRKSIHNHRLRLVPCVCNGTRRRAQGHRAQGGRIEARPTQHSHSSEHRTCTNASRGAWYGVSQRAGQRCVGREPGCANPPTANRRSRNAHPAPRPRTIARYAHNHKVRGQQPISHGWRARVAPRKSVAEQTSNAWRCNAADCATVGRVTADRAAAPYEHGRQQDPAAVGHAHTHVGAVQRP